MTALSSITDSLSDLGILKPARQIGPYSSSFPLPDGVTQFTPIVAQVTVKESPIDELEITKHPVEQGASMTDHAYKLQAELILEVGWSNSGLDPLINDALTAFSLLEGGSTGTFNYSQKVYQQLLSIQLSRIPINIVTGKRKYKNMLIKRITAPTYSETENALFATLTLYETLVAVTVASNFPDTSVQANPQNTGTIQNTGSAQPSITSYQLNDLNFVGPPAPGASYQ